MQTIKAYYDGNVFVPTMHVNAKKNVPVIVTFLEDENIDYKNEHKQKHHSNTDWLNDPWKIENFKPLSREEIYAKA
ncbi:MAG: hypothetical protein Ta2F_12970 [Termitinemataceae bacterium]|nr:MAG: hypothetical protein Ta2F_12970 [Termitinemataceae bacterium]